ncbi:tryptophan synthase subunit alpha [Candidatus Peregrinibacteria bacterium]|nr:tryptophan synthase subunit alpha [Candidatus Peregrinibacteria bacterium]
MHRIQQKSAQIKSENRVGLMTHVVVGFPTLKKTEELIDAMIENSVDFIELQIPFSDPIADGPTILKASDTALKNGTKVKDAFDLVKRIREKNDEIPLLFMSYANIILQIGVQKFVQKSKEVGIDGFIIPDLPPDESEGEEFLKACEEYDLAPILILSPTSSEERMKYIAEKGKGFFYSVARTGVTGAETTFSEELGIFLKKCRKVTTLPLAVGFGISKPEHIQFLKGKAEVAVVGSETLRILEKDGIDAVSEFINSLVEAGK